MARKKTPKKAPKSKRKPRKKKPKRTLSLQKVADSTGFSYRQLLRFTQRGLPHSKKRNPKGGKPMYILNVAEVIEWCSNNGIVTPAGKGKAAEDLAKASAAMPAGPQAPQAGKTPAGGQNINQENVRAVGIVGALERLRLQEYNVSVLIVRRLGEGCTRDELTSLQAFHTKVATQLRLTEFAVLKYREAHGELVKFGEMVTAWERIGVGFKNTVLGIPSTVVPRIHHLLKDPDSGMAEAEKIIDEECRLALMSLPDEIPTGSDSESDSGGNASPAS